MLKKFVLALFILTSGTIFAQSPLPLGMNQFNAGLGFSDYGVPLYIGFDHSVHNNVSLGLELSYRNFDRHFYHYDIFTLAGNVNYHFNQILRIPNNWDFYAGLSVAYLFDNSPYDYDHYRGLALFGQIGGRYYFTRSTGINLELGGGSYFSGGRIGISYRY